MKKNIKTVSIMLVVMLALSLFIFEGMADAEVIRRGGADRYETSALTSRDVYTDCDTVIIARGDAAGQFADGLAASVLAGALKAPVLLTKPDSLPTAIKKEIERLEADKAIVLGGKKAISDNVVSALKKMGLTVERIDGKDRYETAAKIAREADRKGYTISDAFIVNGFATADSLVAGPAAFRDGMPILLVSRDSIPSATKNVLKSLGIERVYIVGGKAVVSNSVENSLDGLTSYSAYRLGGADRFETSVKMAEEFFANDKDAILVGGLDANLADSIGACIYELPILYVRRAAIPTTVRYYLEDILTCGSVVKIMGGTAAVSRSVENEVDDIIYENCKGSGKEVTDVDISGSTVVGETLTAIPTPSGATVTYQWMRSSSPSGTYTNISGATSKTYKPVASDEGGYIRVKATGTSTYWGAATSPARGPVTATATTPTQNGAPAFTGGIPATYGTQLTVGPGTLGVKTNLTYTWYRSDDVDFGTGDTIVGTGETYTPAAGDVGKYLIVVATTPDATGRGIVTTAAVVAKATATVTLGELEQTYNGYPKQATATTVPNGLSVIFTYDGSENEPIDAGSYVVAATIDDNRYTGGATGTLEIAKADPEVTAWPTASAINLGDPLSASTLSGGSASVPGSFVFEEPGTEPDGTGFFPVIFIPTDANNYNTVPGGSVEVTVNARALTLARSGSTGTRYVTVTSNYGDVVTGTQEATITSGGPEETWISLGDKLEARVTTPFPGNMNSLILTPTDNNNRITITGTKKSYSTVQSRTLTVEIRDKTYTTVTGSFTVTVSASGVAYFGTTLTIGRPTI